MSNLDSIVATLDEGPLPGLNFSLSSSQAANYVRERHFSTYFPPGSNIYSPTLGQRVIRINVRRGEELVGPVHGSPGLRHREHRACRGRR